jgi:hypothetical protein
MVAKLKVALAAALLLGVSAAAVAADYYLDVANRTGYTIVYLHVSPAKSVTLDDLDD